MPLRNDWPHRQGIPVATGARRAAYLMAAGIFFLLGVAGILLPGLPTTPFLLLTSYFLLRSSPSLNERMLNSRFLGPILRDWHEHRGVRPIVKLRAALLVVVLLAASAYFGNLPVIWTVIILALGGVGLTVIFYLPTIPSRNHPANTGSPNTASVRVEGKAALVEVSPVIDRAD